jgi:LDH2 family malate/lactate/ureidoglycolate dehydrogenase
MDYTASNSSCTWLVKSRQIRGVRDRQPRRQEPAAVARHGHPAVTLAKLHQIEARGEKAPENCVLDASGKPTTNPTEGLLARPCPWAAIAVLHSPCGEIFTGVLSGSTNSSAALYAGAHDKDMNLSFSCSRSIRRS